MDYEKKYKDALEWAKKVMQGKVGFVLDDVLEKFPELKESEDEITRKEIIEYLKLFGKGKEDYFQPTVDRWIAWLEKHDDKVEPKFKVGQTIKKEGFNLGFTIEKVEDGFYYNDMGDYFPFTDQDNWELVEQNPAWSEEDEKIINGITSYLCTHDSCELDGFDKWYDFLKSLKDRVQPQPKQDWSEDDDFMVENVRNSFGLHCGQMTPALQEQYRKFFDKVKAIKLQPNWKPSKEQIKSLYNSIPDAALCEREILTQLYVDLKKLKE